MTVMPALGELAAELETAYHARGSRKDTIQRLVRDLAASVQSMIDAGNAAIEAGHPAGAAAEARR